MSITDDNNGWRDDTLQDLGQDWTDAYNAGDTAGMAAAHEAAEEYRESLNPSYEGSDDGSTFTGPSSSYDDSDGDGYNEGGDATGLYVLPSPPTWNPPTLPNPIAPKAPENIKICKYEYVYGVQDLQINSKEYTDRSILVSKPINIDGNVMQVSLTTKETHPLFSVENPNLGTPATRQTSIEYYITHTGSPTKDEWYPIIPEDQITIKNELLILQGNKAKLRFPLNPVQGVVIYNNGYVVKDKIWSIGTTFQDIQLSSVTPGSIYTIDYTPNLSIVNPYIVDFQLAGAKPVKQADVFPSGTNRNGVIVLNYYPYINYELVNTTEGYDPNTPSGYKPILVTIENANVVGEDGDVLSQVNPYSLSDSIYTKNITDYKTRGKVILTPYDPTDNGAGGLVNPAIEYCQTGKYLAFTETFNRADIEENMSINHGNGQIKVEYERLVTEVRLKVILRSTAISRSRPISPILEEYALKFKVMK